MLIGGIFFKPAVFLWSHPVQASAAQGTNGVDIHLNKTH